MTPHFIFSGLFLAVGACALWLAYYKGFFRAFREFSLDRRIAFGGLVIIFSLYFGLQMALGLGAADLFGPFAVQSGGWTHIAIFAITISAVLAYKGRFFLKGPFLPHLGFGMLTLLLVYPISAGLGQLGEGIIQALGGSDGEQVAVNHLRRQLDYPFLFGVSTLMVVIAVPIGEEMLFRGALQGWLRKWMSPLSSIVVSSVLFTVIHLTPSQKWANLSLILVLIPLALCLGYLYERQRSLWAPIALHGIFNGINVLGIFFMS